MPVVMVCCRRRITFPCSNEHPLISSPLPARANCNRKQCKTMQCNKFWNNESQRNTLQSRIYTKVLCSLILSWALGNTNWACTTYNTCCASLTTGGAYIYRRGERIKRPMCISSFAGGPHHHSQAHIACCSLWLSSLITSYNLILDFNRSEPPLSKRYVHHQHHCHLHVLDNCK